MEKSAEGGEGLPAPEGESRSLAVRMGEGGGLGERGLLRDGRSSAGYIIVRHSFLFCGVSHFQFVE